VTRHRKDRDAKAESKSQERFPGRDEIVAFIRESSDKAIGTREIARAFILKNADSNELKRLLRDLADE
jgi:hypothetical protein